MSDSVALLLKELRLPAFGRHYQSLWETAVEKSWSHTDYLAALCEYELSDRYHRRTQKWVREAKLQQDIDWARKADNVLLLGPSGTGKTHVAVALGHTLIEQGVR